MRWIRDVGVGRLASVGALLLLVIFAHAMTPVDTHPWHSVHVLLRKLLLLPVVLSAIWFDLRGALVTAALVTLGYLPHVLLQWSGQLAENINQLGELGTVWLGAALVGSLAGREKSALREVAAAHEGTLVGLVSALDAREHDTELHSLRVRAYALRLGRELAMEKKELVALARAALLHDVGKIGVPDHILLKPGPLTENEWEWMRKHVDFGREIVKGIGFLDEAAEIIHCHHERFDGSGYPRGLAGQAIPLSARIFAVVDVFDALTSKRAYREAGDYDEAVKTILEGRGSDFDPQVVDVFVAIPPQEWQRIGGAVEAPVAGACGSSENLPAG